MKRNIDINEISDGRLYSSNDMAKIDCHGCVNCSACCCNMGESIVLDPLDVYNLCIGLSTDFNTLLKNQLEINVVDGIALPNIKMKDSCQFLNKEGMCDVHSFRPGICRLFPLGRIYEDDGFKYFIQVHECPVPNKGKVKVHKWIGVKDLPTYEKYILEWHNFLKACQDNMAELSEEQVKILSMLILRTFYETPYGDEFYEDFYSRLEKIKDMLGL